MPETLNTMKQQRKLFLELSFDSDPAVAFAGHVSAINVTPNTGSASWNGGDENTLSETYVSGHTLSLNVAQDTENPDSLFNVMIAHRGEVGTWKYGPQRDGVFRTTVDAVVIPPAVGGPVNQFNESTVSMGCSDPDYTQPA